MQADKHERFFGFVTAVDADKGAITAGLQAQTNETKTRGTRHTGPARAAGEGRRQSENARLPCTLSAWRALCTVPRPAVLHSEHPVPRSCFELRALCAPEFGFAGCSL